MTSHAFEVFSERDQLYEKLSILTCTEEEEVRDYFDAELDEQDLTITSLTTSVDLEAVWNSCVTSDASSVLSGSTTPTSSVSRKTSPRVLSCPFRLSISEVCALRKVKSMSALYRPSQLGIGIHNTTGDN
ncbi:hypothetical protein PsorP6_001488 [Peronosclerospora sorghi]|uniref:Uncharacterized protein n=1 Tax=Peronosclerospora sorghi TaxID=230839 RepID=A0ACC0WVJ4_9STRA|nr:hypothetical protein PsorP6_001488 [Peronosclerospora sorghi]